MPDNGLTFTLGVKSDPIEYRYSYPWLFRLMAEEDVEHVQLGTFFEIYQLPDEFFIRLRQQAFDYGVTISSLFTAHRELGGFFRSEPGFVEVARRNFERYIEVAALLRARRAGSNPGAVLRDEIENKDAGTACYIAHMKELMHKAHAFGLEQLTIEPMSCLAEPPVLPGEMASMGAELMSYHAAHPDTSSIGYCTDIAHGYVNSCGTVVHDHFELLEASYPHLAEIHLKNTDARYDSTFGFTEADRARGIIDVGEVAARMREKGGEIPLQEVVGYLEIGGPKLGRDYSDPLLEDELRESLRYLKTVWK